MTSTLSPRLRHAIAVEQSFADSISTYSNWEAIPFGQALLPDATHAVLQQLSIHPNSPEGRYLITLLPEDWQHIYKRGLKNGIPSLCRWDADFLMAFNGQPKFFAEVKSSRPGSLNASIEISCLLAAIWNKRRLGCEQIFIFSPFENVNYWTYLTLEQVLSFAGRPNDGNGARGSGTPFVLLSRKYLTNSVDKLLSIHETTSTL